MKIWRNLSITFKLYAVTGFMALFIALELYALSYSVETMSTLRSFFEGESRWAKGQKDSVLNLYQYASTHDESDYDLFIESLKIPHGFKKARIALESLSDTNAYAGFREAGFPQDEIGSVIAVIRHLRGFPHMGKSIDYWRKADEILFRIETEASKLRAEITAGRPNQARIKSILAHVSDLNVELTEMNGLFTKSLSEGAKFLDRAIIVILLFNIVLFGTIATYFIYRFASYLTTSIEEIKNTTVAVGAGDYERRVSVRSKDELGQLAQGLNHMIQVITTTKGKQEKAESANHVKTLFLANMSHEVRTPLGVILGLVEILKSKQLDHEGRQKYLEIIERTGHNLERIINDILDISKVEAGHLEVTQTRFNLNDFVDEVSANLQLLADRGKNRLDFHGDGKLPVAISGDRARLGQILNNLVGNALKFTQNGEVSVAYWVLNGKINFRVKDNGIGIPESERDKLFKPFSQVDYSTTRKYGGTGLGLLLSKRLAQAMGGDIELESSHPGLGSTFLFTLPLPSDQNSAGENGAHALPSTKDSPELQGRKILLVEDSFDNQMLIQLFLSEKGVQLDFANDGREGEQKALTHKYDLVLMDMQMPITDGYTATENLRRRGYKGPIIALTAHAMKDDRERCLSVGCDDYLTKPINLPLFYHTLASHT